MKMKEDQVIREAYMQMIISEEERALLAEQHLLDACGDDRAALAAARAPPAPAPWCSLEPRAT